ncbi:MAG TPA: hypothetical protein VLV16_11110 [Gemmatimonadales bacterium]|nr:hypothetical protein [Gemmatimonadales bacterium]
MRSHIRVLVGLALGATLVLGACSESTAPTFSDPMATASQAAALDSALGAPAVASFQSLTANIQLAPPVSRIAGAVRTMSLAQPGRDRYAALARQSQALKQVVPAFATAAATGLFPDSTLGWVFGWDTGSSQYVRVATTGGPTNGVRFLLYEVNASGHPVIPLNQVGYADFMDEGTGNVAVLHIQIKSNSGQTTYLDYTFTGSGNSASFNASVTGFVSNGLGPVFNKTLTFTVTIAGTQSSVTFTSNYSLNNPQVTVQEAVTASDNGTTTTLAINFTFTGPRETVSMSGTLGISDADLSATIDLTFRINGHTIATVTGSTDNPVITHSGGGELTTNERTALTYLFLAAANLASQLNDVFAPAQNVLGF